MRGLNSLAFILTLGATFANASPSRAASDPPRDICLSRVNGTTARLTECIQQQPLFDHLVRFQHIADQHPGLDGHGNRDTGTAGYKASVDYVAGLMRKAGYKVTIQPYDYTSFSVVGTPVFSAAGVGQEGKDWYVARLSGRGATTAPLQPVGGIAKEGPGSGGCAAEDFAGFAPGNVALIQRGGCDLDVKVANARAAKASAVVLFNDHAAPDQLGARGGRPSDAAYPAKLQAVAGIPVVGVISYAAGEKLYAQHAGGHAAPVHLDIETRTATSNIDYNVIADSRFGDTNHTVVVDAHLDSIYGAGILDNATGSATILEIALNLASTPTRNHLRFIWFGGEEIDLLGSRYYVKALPRDELKKIAFDIDADVTATPNYDISVADPALAPNVKHFPPNVVPQSRRGNQYFFDYFQGRKIPVRNASFGNEGTDSNSFSKAGVPNTGILTQQECCKSQKEVDIWGGFRGNYEGNIPSFDGGCVDTPHRWCDNLDNTSPYIMEIVSKSVAFVTLKLADDPALGGK